MQPIDLRHGLAKHSAHYVRAFAVAVSFSGYTFTSISANVLQQDYATRALVTLVLLALAGGLWLFASGGIQIPAGAFLLASPIVYLIGVAIARGEPSSWIAPALRWSAYLAALVGFFNLSENRSHLRIFTETLGWTLAGQVLLDVVLGRGLELNAAFRVGGSVGSAIGMAAALSACGLVSFYSWTALRRPSSLALTIVSGIAIIPTGTRSVLVGYLLLLPLIVFLAARGTRKLLSLVIGGTIVSTSAYLVITYTQVGQRLLFSSLSEDSSTAFRVRIIDSLSQFEGVPLLIGTGLGGFPGWFRSVTGMGGVAPHFETVWILVEGGILGLTLYGASLIVTVAAALYGNSATEDRTPAIFLAVLILLQQGLFQFANPSYFYQAMLPLYAAIGTLFGVISPSMPPSGPPAISKQITHVI